MRIHKCILPAVIVLFIALIVAPMAMGNLTGVSVVGSPTYHRFLVADLGIVGGGGRHPVFSVTFDGIAGTEPHRLYIEVDDGSGNTLMSGYTGSANYTSFGSRTIYNYDLKGIFGSGSMTLSDDAKNLKKIILATGALPQGTCTIEVTLYDAGSNPRGSDSAGPITITPPYLQPVSPVDVSATRSALSFWWNTNIENQSFHLYSDPRGNNEVISVEGLGSPRAGSVDGAAVASDLEDGLTYYWQIHGTVSTTHGDEVVKGPLSRFVYFESASSVMYLGLSDADKALITDELIAILTELVNKRAAKSIKEYDLDRIVLDNGVVSRDEIMAILLLIKEKQVKVNSIYFR